MIKKRFIETFTGIILGLITGLMLGAIAVVIVLFLIHGIEFALSGDLPNMNRIFGYDGEILIAGMIFGSLIGSIMGGVAYLKD